MTAPALPQHHASGPVRPERPVGPLGPADPVPTPGEPLVLGVATAVAARFGASVPIVRAAFVVTSVAGGFGVVVYLLIALLWRDRSDLAGRPSGLGRDAGMVLVTLGTVWELGYWWPGVRTELVVPVGLVALGVALGWRTGPDATPSERFRAGTVVARIAGGAVLCVGGLAVFLGQRVDLATLRDTGIALAVALGGMALVAGPSVVRFARSFSAERDQRIRVQERAAVAAHLHDSVLQTLTLIQKRAEDPAATASLARHQERSLRRWLYGGDEPDAAGGIPGGDDGDWRRRVETMVGEVEDLHAVAVELVMVGDGDWSPAIAAAVAAAREALVNAAKFSGVIHLSMYCEWSPTRFDVFVRDRGKGFDPTTVEDDRRGIRDSIVGRMASAGGVAEVRSAPGEGTEVVIGVPRVRRSA